MDKSTWFLNLSCLNLIHTRYYIETNGFYKTIWQNIRQIAFSCSHVQIVPCLMFDILFYTLNNITFMRFLKLFYECFIPISKIWIVRALKLKYRKIMLICIGVAYKIVLQFLLTNTKKKNEKFLSPILSTGSKWVLLYLFMFSHKERNVQNENVRIHCVCIQSKQKI